MYVPVLTKAHQVDELVGQDGAFHLEIRVLDPIQQERSRNRLVEVSQNPQQLLGLTNNT